MNIFKATLNTVAGIATLTVASVSAIAPASAETLILTPKPGICATKPWLCGGGGVLIPNPTPLPPAPPPAPSGGLTKNEKLALGIAGGVLAGAVLLNAAKTAQQNAAVPVNEGNYQAHVAWCSGKYKSYVVQTNSWQPKGGGPRKPCNSPYL